MKGNIIVIEGIDGSGKKTQSEKLFQYLISKGLQCKLLSFPSYQETFFGKEIANYLNGVFGSLHEIHPKLAAILYAGDRFEKRDYIMNEIERGTILICDRYVPSNIAHHASKLPAPDHLKFKEWIELLEYHVFRLPQPDYVIFLDMPPHLSMRLVLEKDRRNYTSKKQDLHEEDQEYLMRVYDVFNLLSQDNNWTRIKCYENDSLRTIEDIHDQVTQTIATLLTELK